MHKCDIYSRVGRFLNFIKNFWCVNCFQLVDVAVGCNSMSRFLVIAIDGTAASGKTTTSLAVAKKYNLMVATTGTYYRAITLFMIKNGVDSGDLTAIENLLRLIELSYFLDGNVSRIAINNIRFSDSELRSEVVNLHVAKYSSVPTIREFLIDFQRNQVGIARDNGFCGIVMEGRDITSVILPHADLKFFLIASENDRAKRRALDGELDCIKNRDKIDEARTICGSDVTVIDTSINKLQDVIDIISEKIEKLGLVLA